MGIALVFVAGLAIQYFLFLYDPKSFKMIWPSILISIITVFVILGFLWIIHLLKGKEESPSFYLVLKNIPKVIAKCIFILCGVIIMMFVVVGGIVLILSLFSGFELRTIKSYIPSKYFLLIFLYPILYLYKNRK